MTPVRRRANRRLVRWRGEYPDGRKPGLKEDSPSKIMDCCDPIVDNDYFEPIHEDHWSELCNTAVHKSREQRYRWTLDQNGRGSCGAECVHHGRHANETRQDPGGFGVLTNPWGTYRITSGGRDNGSVIRENVELIMRDGCHPEELHPRSLGWRAEPSAEANRVAKLLTLKEFYYIERISDMISALLQGFEVIGGYAGHAISFCQYMGRGLVKYKNSWGDWGAYGFGTLATRDVYLGYGLFAFKSVSILDPDDWSPRYDQADLARRVNRFMSDVNGVERAGSSRVWSRKSWLEDLYNQHLAGCELAL